MANSSWFEVDKAGLGRILRRRGLEFIAFELISNAWDSEATEVAVTLKAEGSKMARITVEDNDPNGFADVTHAYTMFADSNRRDDLSKRGRFDLGEKLALAVAEEATIITTTGGYRFDKTGRHSLTQRTRQGSRVELLFPATGKDIEEILAAIGHLVPPVHTTVNGELLTSPALADTITATLGTVIPDGEGNLKHYTHKTQVEVFRNSAGKVYELGVPIVETGDTYCYDVQQKVPLNMERDNVTPAYLRRLRVAVVNAMYESLTPEDCNMAWIKDAMSDTGISPEAVKAIIEQRFGDQVVSFDMSDREANNIAASQGYVVINGNCMSAAEWENVRKAGAVLPAGKVTPSPRLSISEQGEDQTLPLGDYTDGMRQIVSYTKCLARELIDHEIEVKIVRKITSDPNVEAAYGSHSMLFNLRKLGKAWFEEGITDRVVALIIHELGHEYESNHLSRNYYDALCDLGAKMRRLGHLDSAEAVRS